MGMDNRQRAHEEAKRFMVWAKLRRAAQATKAPPPKTIQQQAWHYKKQKAAANILSFLLANAGKWFDKHEIAAGSGYGYTTVYGSLHAIDKSRIECRKRKGERCNEYRAVNHGAA